MKNVEMELVTALLDGRYHSVVTRTGKIEGVFESVGGTPGAGVYIYNGVSGLYISDSEEMEDIIIT